MTGGRIVLPALQIAETLSTFMESAGPNPERFLSSFGRLVLDAETIAEDKHKRVVVFGEMVALLCAEGRVKATIELEQLGNELAQTHSFYARCAYPMSEGLKGEPYRNDMRRALRCLTRRNMISLT